MEHDEDHSGKKNIESGQIITPEINILDKQINKLTKGKEKSDELNKKVNLVYD